MDFVNDLKDFTAFAVHLVTEGQNGQITQTTDFKELLGLALHALGTVNHHHGRIHGSERAIGVLREVRVTRCVHQIEPELLEFKGHCGGGDRDATVLFHLHKVRAGPPGLALGTHLSGHLNSATIKEEFFGQRGLSRIRMGDNREGATTRNFGGEDGLV